MGRIAPVLALLLVACGSSSSEPERPRDETTPAGPVAVPAPAGEPAAPGRPCGLSPDDWCPSPAGDPCGAHADTEACRADDRCEGMPYQGESLVACALDARCFATNCPTVGCVSRCEGLDQAACTAASVRCAWNEGCARREPCAP